MKTGDWLIEAEKQLKAAGIESARLDSRILLERVTGEERFWLLAHAERTLSRNVLKKLHKDLQRRRLREPLAYVTGYKEFYGLSFKVTKAVLIPRPETEAMVQAAVESAPRNGRVLELGTGSGCVAIALKLERADLEVTATDISPAALEAAQINAKRHTAAINFIKSDLFSEVSGRYDLVLANLPYVPSGTRRQPELDFEPALALYGGTDGLDYYRRFLKERKTYLVQPGGQVLIEAGPTQRLELKRLAGAVGFDLSSISEYVSLLTYLGSKRRTGAGL